MLLVMALPLLSPSSDKISTPLRTLSNDEEEACGGANEAPPLEEAGREALRELPL
jgi:hypothetical protein